MLPQTPFLRNTLFSNNKFQGNKFLEFVSPQKKSGLNEGFYSCLLVKMDALYDGISFLCKQLHKCDAWLIKSL